MKKESNIAYIDGQNLHLGTKAAKWQIDFMKFRVYLRDKYKVNTAYYFLGFLDEEQQELYTHLQEAGFVIVFREHTSNLKGKKKGNVDVDIVFEMMKSFVEEEEFDNIVLVSGDGDYIKPVKYLIKKGRFKKILFPNKNYSSLYKQIQDRYSVNMSLKDIRSKISFDYVAHKKKGERHGGETTEKKHEKLVPKTKSIKKKKPRRKKNTTKKGTA